MGKLDRAIGNALSFSGTMPPEPCKVIGREERGAMGMTIYYEAEESGNFYYITERGLEFARRMEAAARKTKK